METWDVYNADRKLTGSTIIRDELLTDDCFHLVCEVIVMHTDGTYLLMRRAHDKSYEGCYESSAGGSALQGENEYECIKRELFEETGLICNSFVNLGFQIYPEDNCHIYSFKCVVDCDKKCIICQDSETDGYMWVSKSELINFVK